MYKDNFIKKQYAICLLGEPRAIRTTVDNFYKNVVFPLNADIFIMFQDTQKNNNIELYDKNVISKILYTKPDTNDYFKDIYKLKDIDENISYPGALQPILNIKFIADKYGNILEKNYESIIVTRSDFLYLFKFTDIINKNVFWSYEDDRWEGYNLNLVIVPNKYIKQYLNSFYNYLTMPSYYNKLIKNGKKLNCERLGKFIFKNENWQMNFIKSNAFLTADSIDSISVWSSIKQDKNTKMYYKYIVQYTNALTNFKKYKLNIHNRYLT